MSNHWIGWLGFVTICFGAGVIGSRFTASSVRTWYPTLLKPRGTPPSWVFAPVWSTLYLLMATAAWLVWRQRSATDVSLALGLFFAQLALNAAWSFIFFGLRRPGPALIEIVLLVGVIVMTIVKFLSFSPVTSWLMVPYLAWVLYASFLNFGIWRLNKGDA